MRTRFNRIFSFAAIPLILLAFLAPARHHPLPWCRSDGRCRVTVVTFTSAGSGTWLAPAGVTSISVAVWGGGGGGQRGSGGQGGNAGGGGEYAAESAVQVAPGVLYSWTVGTGGQGAQFGGADSSAGGSSSFTASSLTVTGHGGDRGGGDGLGGSGSTNTTHFSGGSGGTGSGTGARGGGGGGSSAGTAATGGNGGNATFTTAGAGGSPPAGGGAGGQGGASPTAAVNGSAPGGGGGGGAGGGGAARPNGGNGSAGMVQITYTAPQQPQVPFFPAGYAPTSQDFTNWVTNPLAFLTSKIAFRGVCGSAVVLAANTNEVLPFTVLEDPQAGWQSGSSQWLAPQSGLYSVTLTTSCAANSNQPVLASKVGLNSQASTFTLAKAWVPPSSVPGLASGALLLYLYGGQDSVQGIAEAIGAAGTVATGTGIGPRLSVMWISELCDRQVLLPQFVSPLVPQDALPARLPARRRGRVGILWRHLMAVDASVPAFRPPCHVTAAHVLRMGHRLQVCRVHAGMNSAQVVYVKFIGDRTVDVLVSPAVSTLGIGSGIEEAVAILVRGSRPQPTGTQVGRVRRYGAVLADL